MLSPSSKTKLKLSLFSCFYVVHVVLRIDYAFVGIYFVMQYIPTLIILERTFIF